VIAFQQDVYLTPNGICDALTFLALAQILSASVKRNNDNQIGIVRRLQDRLVALQNLAPAQIGNGYGNFGPLTEGGLKRLQQQQNQPQDGILTVASYLRLRALAPNAAPAITPSTDGNDTAVNVQLPPGGPGFIIKLGSPPEHQFATERTINRFMAIASAWNATGVGFPLRVGEMSIKGGGLFGAHTGEGHRDGFALDLGLFRKDRKNQPTNINDPTYDRALTQQLITALDQSPLVVLMIFNDRQISAGNKVRHDKEGTHIHDNHVHLEFRKRSA
jgi:peptidoglycan hydrolase-like protein with peptidoglycan-binding domain